MDRQAPLVVSVTTRLVKYAVRMPHEMQSCGTVARAPRDDFSAHSAMYTGTTL